MSWLKEVIGTEKAVIAMCHLRALPGDPSFDERNPHPVWRQCAVGSRRVVRSGHGNGRKIHSRDFYRCLRQRLRRLGYQRRRDHSPSAPYRRG